MTGEAINLQLHVIVKYTTSCLCPCDTIKPIKPETVAMPLYIYIYIYIHIYLPLHSVFVVTNYESSMINKITYVAQTYMPLCFEDELRTISFKPTINSNLDKYINHVYPHRYLLLYKLRNTYGVCTTIHMSHIDIYLNKLCTHILIVFALHNNNQS